jgi:hypothetical protein
MTGHRVDARLNAITIRPGVSNKLKDFKTRGRTREDHNRLWETGEPKMFRPSTGGIMGHLSSAVMIGIGATMALRGRHCLEFPFPITGWLAARAGDGNCWSDERGLGNGFMNVWRPAFGLDVE